MCLLNSLARVTVECSVRGRWQLGRIAAESYCNPTKQLIAGVWSCFSAAHVHSVQHGLTDKAHLINDDQLTVAEVLLQLTQSR